MVTLSDLVVKVFFVEIYLLDNQPIRNIVVVNTAELLDFKTSGCENLEFLS